MRRKSTNVGRVATTRKLFRHKVVHHNHGEKPTGIDSKPFIMTMPTKKVLISLDPIFLKTIHDKDD